MRIRDF